MTSLAVSDIFWFVARALFKHKWMKFSRELLLDAHQGTVLLDVSVLVGIEAERGGREKDTGRRRRLRRRRRGEGVYRRQAASLAAESLPRRSFFFIGQSKHRTGNLCLPLQRAPGSWCHNTKWDGANRSAVIKNKRGGCLALLLFFFSTEGWRRMLTWFPRERHAKIRNPCSQGNKGHSLWFGWVTAGNDWGSLKT